MVFIASTGQVINRSELYGWIEFFFIIKREGVGIPIKSCRQQLVTQDTHTLTHTALRYGKDMNAFHFAGDRVLTHSHDKRMSQPNRKIQNERWVLHVCVSSIAHTGASASPNV